MHQIAEQKRLDVALANASTGHVIVPATVDLVQPPAHPAHPLSKDVAVAGSNVQVILPGERDPHRKQQRNKAKVQYTDKGKLGISVRVNTAEYFGC